MEYTSIYTIKDIDVIDGNNKYTMNMTRALIDTPDALTPVADAVYRLSDDLFGDRYEIILKPEYRGLIKAFDHPVSAKRLDSASLKYDVSRILRNARNRDRMIGALENNQIG